MSEHSRKEKVRIWGERIEAQVQSGRSVRVFCEEHQLKISTFFYWRNKFCKSAHKNLVLSSPSRFVAISQTHVPPKSPLIHLPNGVQIELGGGLDSVAVSQFIRGLCGVGHAKP